MVLFFLIAIQVGAKTNSTSSACIHMHPYIRAAGATAGSESDLSSELQLDGLRLCWVYLRFSHSKLFSACVPLLAPPLDDCRTFRAICASKFGRTDPGGSSEACALWMSGQARPLL